MAFFLAQCYGMPPIALGNGFLSNNASGQEEEEEEEEGVRGRIRQRLHERLNKINNKTAGYTTQNIAGLEVAIWKPSTMEQGKAPLVIFSHGFGGSATQSAFLMDALARAGYLVIAPNHKDAHGSTATNFRPQVGFKNSREWSDKTHLDRHDDIVKLISALHSDPQWNKQIDWSELALCGHSLGGYTVLGLAGAWPSWKIPGVKAVIALSPYVTPYIESGNLAGMHVPVMYQGGTKDFGITPFVRRPGGAYEKTSAPAYFVEFDQFTHFTWSNFNREPDKQAQIDYYCIAFLNKYARGEDDGTLQKRIAGVVDFKSK
ncbi:MAG: alpha/beta hydrolase [Candidatus Obscuribacterales bacterium]